MPNFSSLCLNIRSPWPESSFLAQSVVDDFHHLQDLLFLPLLPDDLNSNGHALHSHGVVERSLALVELIFDDLRSKPGAVNPFVGKLIDIRIDSCDGNTPHWAVDYVVKDCRSSQ